MGLYIYIFDKLGSLGTCIWYFGRFQPLKHIYQWLGMMKFPRHMETLIMFQSTNQIGISGHNSLDSWENLQETIDFTIFHMRLSCKFSLQPIHWITVFNCRFCVTNPCLGGRSRRWWLEKTGPRSVVTRVTVVTTGNYSNTNLRE